MSAPFAQPPAKLRNDGEMMCLTNEYITYWLKLAILFRQQWLHTFNATHHREKLLQAFGMISEQLLPSACECEVDVTGDDQISLGAHDMDV